MAKMLMVKQNADWADELTLEGFLIISAEDWEARRSYIENKVEYPKEIYFGSNEFVVMESAKEIMDGLTVVELTEEEEQVIRKMFAPSYLQMKDLAFDYGLICIPE